ncbi:hypothetical protein H0N96_01020 [Candidatus Micrarchaeota archaeon]|nr:hypothetical protein [Candidatus Micrarchaeota archaeon]
MAKKSLARKALGGLFFLVKGFFKILWKLLLALFWVFKKLFSFLFSRGKDFAKHKVAEGKKPKAGASFEQLVEVKKLSGDLGEFEKRLLSSKSLIGIIIGARGSGKSALGLRLLENARAKGRTVAAMGFSEETLPSWINCVSELNSVKNGSFLLVDEGGILFSSRESFSDANKLLSELLLISRHKDLSVLFISQNSSNLDVNTLRQADYLLLRRPSLLQKDFERKIIQKIYEEQAGNFKQLGEHVTLVYSDWFRGFAENELPSFWSEAASKSFKNYKVK